MPLSEEQRQSLEQLWAVTASDSDASRERDERLLRENGFDVQVSDLPSWSRRCLATMYNVRLTLE